MENFVGKRLDGRYELQEIVGVGGMAVVYKAYDSIEGRTVAVKILKEEYVANEDFLRRFKNESKAIAVLSHPNIVKVYDVSFGDLMQYIVMEYIDGITLKEYIDQQGSLSWKDAIHFTIQILRGLQHAHDKGIVHRDVKPQNIMLCSDGTIKVTDFGIARFARSEHKTMTDKAIGSVHYISPEQARGETTDEKADVYSVGVMLYEMLTGQLPFQADSAVSVAIMQLQTEPQLPREINGSIPIGLEQITMHAMQKDPARRYQLAAEMLKDLEEFRRDPAITFRYDYFVDNSPTKYVSTAEIRAMEPRTEREESQEEEEKKSGVLPVLAGITGAVVVCLVIMGFLLYPRLFGTSGNAIDCPNLLGVDVQELEDGDYQGCKVQIVAWENNNDYPYGQVFEQDPEAGRSIKDSRVIEVKVSSGKFMVKVLDVYNMEASTAVRTLENAGFKVVQAEVANDQIAPGAVVNTYPVRGDSVEEGSTVTIYVSTGSPTVYVDVPSLVGKTEDVAKQLILEKGLTIGSVSSVNSDSPAGIVVSQSPDPKRTSQAEKGTAVNISVSNGVPVQTEAKVQLEVPLPADYRESGDCVVSIWINGERIAGTGTLDTSIRKSYSFELTDASGSGSVTALVRLNNDNYMEYKVDFGAGTASAIRTYDYPKASE